MATNLSHHLNDDSSTTAPLVGMATTLSVVRYNNTSSVLISCNALDSKLIVSISQLFSVLASFCSVSANLTLTLASIDLVSFSSCLMSVRSARGVRHEIKQHTRF